VRANGLRQVEKMLKLLMVMTAMVRAGGGGSTDDDNDGDLRPNQVERAGGATVNASR